MISCNRFTAGKEPIDLFHTQQYAYLLRRMKELKESDGSTMLDNSLITYGAGLGDRGRISFTICQ